MNISSPLIESKAIVENCCEVFHNMANTLMKSNTYFMSLQEGLAVLSFLQYLQSSITEGSEKLLTYIYVLAGQNLKSKIFEVKCVSPEYFEYLLSTATCKGPFVGDIKYCALLSIRSLAILSVRSKSWIKLVKPATESTEMDKEKYISKVRMTDSVFEENEYLIQCYGVSSIKKDFVLYVTNQKYFDIVQKFNANWFQIQSFKVQISESKIEYNPEIAKSVLFSVAKWEIDVDSPDMKIIVNFYFKTPKYVRRFELIEINVQKILPYLGNSISNVNVNKLYLKVQNVVGSSDNPRDEYVFYIIGKETEINFISEGIGYLPQEYTKFVYINDKIGYEIPICPGGMEKYFNKVQDILLIFLRRSETRLKPMILLSGMKGSGKKTIMKCITSRVGLHFISMNCFDYIRLDGQAFKTKFEKLLTTIVGPTVLYMDNIELVGRDENNKEDIRVAEIFQKEIEHLFAEGYRFPLIIVGSCNQKIPDLVPLVERMFIQTVSFNAMKREEVEKLLNWLVQEAGMTCYQEVVRASSERLSGYLFADVVKVLQIALKYQREDETILEEVKLLITMEHIEKAIGVVESLYSDSIGSAKVPSVHWDDVGGLEKLKEDIMLSLNLATNHPEFMESGFRVSGFLFYGPPGTGKTLMAKAVATEFNYSFLSVKGPELMNMYVGQSEKNVREVFERAREAAPCIIFFDELDSLAPNRGRESSVVMDRIVSQLLTEMDGLESNAGIFVIGATNRPDLVDPGLLRPGRFDKMFYVGICSNAEMKLSVMKAVTRRFILDDDVNLKEIANKLPAQVTGADLYSLCSNSWLEAARRRINVMNEGKGEIELPVTVNMKDFENALATFVPSLTPEVMRSYEKFKALER